MARRCPVPVKRRPNRCDQRFQLKRLLEHDIVVELALEARPVCITTDEKRLEGRPRAARESYSVRSRQSGHYQIHDHQIAGLQESGSSVPRPETLVKSGAVLLWLRQNGERKIGRFQFLAEPLRASRKG
jgi:hypothetical protein